VPISAEQREQRQQAILKILRRQHVARQEELVELLRKRGIEATQSSISRDLRQLGITKLDQEYRPLAADEDDDTGRDLAMLAEFVEETRTAGPYQTVVKTVTGAAGQVALALDRCGWPEIVGTVSGRHHFIATRTGGDQALSEAAGRLERSAFRRDHYRRAEGAPTGRLLTK
jgi:transcriptional regulator of arginine metabolism